MSLTFTWWWCSACNVAPVGLGTQAVLAPALGANLLLEHLGHQVGMAS